VPEKKLQSEWIHMLKRSNLGRFLFL